jgi:hypothetical protein
MRKNKYRKIRRKILEVRQYHKYTSSAVRSASSPGGTNLDCPQSLSHKSRWHGKKSHVLFDSTKFSFSMFDASVLAPVNLSSALPLSIPGFQDSTVFYIVMPEQALRSQSSSSVASTNAMPTVLAQLQSHYEIQPHAEATEQAWEGWATVSCTRLVSNNLVVSGLSTTKRMHRLPVNGLRPSSNATSRQSCGRERFPQRWWAASAGVGVGRRSGSSICRSTLFPQGRI